MARFRDRAHAGRALAEVVAPLLAGDDALVLGLPRGGVVVGRALADELGLRLDVIVVRKLGVPGHEEFGFGAIGEGGVVTVDHATVAAVGLSEAQIAAVESRERSELKRRAAVYVGAREREPLAGRAVVLVDDGIATGGTMRAAVAVCRAREALRVVVAVGVAPRDTLDALAQEADAAVALLVPEPMMSVGEWYVDFREVRDAEVSAALGVI